MVKKQIHIPVFIPSEGCPEKCVFCEQKQISGHSAFPDKKEIQGIIDRYLMNADRRSTRIELAFFGGTFTGLSLNRQKYYLSAAAPYIKNGVDSLRISTRPDYINPENLDVLKEFNVGTIELGVQSFSDSVLAASGRGMKETRIFSAIEQIKAKDFSLIIQLMTGLPASTASDEKTSAMKAALCKPAGVRIYPCIVIKNTELEKMFKSGTYSPQSLEEAVDICADMHEIFNAEEVPVIRTGLHPFSIHNISSITAGPYHPSFGFLVKSRLRRREIEALFLNAPQPSSDKKLILPLQYAEEYIGNKKENLIFIKERFLLPSLEYHIAAGINSPQLL